MSKAWPFLGVLAILAVPVTIRADVEFGDTQRIITIHGTVAADRKAAEKIGYDAISIGFVGASPDTLRWVGVVKAEAYDGDAFMGKDILDKVDGYTPNLLAGGKSDQLATLRNAPVGSRIVLNGIIDESSRILLVGSVKITPAAAAH